MTLAALLSRLEQAGRQPTEAGTRARWLATVLATAGTPYTWGGSTPNDGFDCSGLVYWCLARHGLHLARKSGRHLWLDHAAARIEPADVQTGDLVFYGQGPATADGSWSHVDIHVAPGLRFGALGARNEERGARGGSVRFTTHRRPDVLAALSITRMLR